MTIKFYTPACKFISISSCVNNLPCHMGMVWAKYEGGQIFFTRNYVSGPLTFNIYADVKLDLTIVLLDRIDCCYRGCSSRKNDDDNFETYDQTGGHYIVTCTSTRDRGQDLDPSNFCAWPLDHTENLALTLDCRALTTLINRLQTVSKLPPISTLITCPASKFHLDCLTSLLPRSRVWSTVTYVVSPHCVPAWTICSTILIAVRSELTVKYEYSIPDRDRLPA